jgi:genome maintenance exonuclease 1
VSFTFSNKFDYPCLERRDNVSGRTYITPYGEAPSVTTILSTIPNKGLKEWRERVGDEEADTITDKAASFGDAVHKTLENMILGNKNTEDSEEVISLSKKMFMLLDRKVNVIHGVESRLHSYDLYAGTSDLICDWNGTLSICDFKTSRSYPGFEKVKKYLLQGAAYSLSHDIMFGTKITRVDIICGIYAKKKEVKHFYIKDEELENLQREWVSLVEAFMDK